MKRYITYLYLYEENKKTKNVGFIRLDLFDESFRMEIHIKNLGRFKGKVDTLLLVKNQGLMGVKAADFEIINGGAAVRIESSINGVFGSEYNFEDIIGVRITPIGGYYIASCWRDEEADLICQDIRKPLKEELVKIDLADIKKLPSKNWYLANNSFLLHGFMNYHYLIVKSVEEEGKLVRYLGVPGIFEEPERMMALLFGFDDFMEGQDSPVGYWLCKLEE